MPEILNEHTATPAWLHKLIAVTLVVSLAAGFIMASEIVLILFLGVLFGVFLTRISRWLESRSRLPRLVGLWALVGLLLLAGIGGAASFFVQINARIDQASGQIEQGVEELRKTIQRYPAVETFVGRVPFVSDALIEHDDRAGEAADPTIPVPVQSAAESLGGLFATTFGLAVNSLLIFFTGLFLAISPEMYRDGACRLAPPRHRPRFREVLDEVGESLWRWLTGRFGSMLITGLGAFGVLWWIGIPMAATLAFVTALLTFVPNIGSAVALMLAVLFALPQGFTAVALVVAAYLVLQLIESYVISPMIQQQHAHLPPALLIASQAVMGILFGFLGAAVASPLLAAAKTAVEMLYIEDVLESETDDRISATRRSSSGDGDYPSNSNSVQTSVSNPLTRNQ